MSDPLGQARVGAAGVKVRRLGFGSAPLGGLLRVTPEADAIDAVHAALDAGLDYFDVAPQYGGGMAEQRLGMALRDRPRDQVVISSKVGKLIRPLPENARAATSGFAGAPAHEVIYDYSYDGVFRSLEDSFRRLAVDRLDIVLVHDVNRKYHGEAVMQRLDEALSGACRALRRLRDVGSIGACGCALNEVDVALCRRSGCRLHHAASEIHAAQSRRGAEAVATLPGERRQGADRRPVRFRNSGDGRRDGGNLQLPDRLARDHDVRPRDGSGLSRFRRSVARCRAAVPAAPPGSGEHSHRNAQSRGSR
jgi:aryl-alcohol dehydrogenase-like predicted oxidoreductase